MSSDPEQRRFEREADIFLAFITGVVCTLALGLFLTELTR